jgi:hypothetical protein
MRPASLSRRTSPVTFSTLAPSAHSCSSPFWLPTSFRRTRCATVVQPPAVKLNAPRATLAPYVGLHSLYGGTLQTASFAAADGGRYV